MILVIEIAAGIVLAVLVLLYWRWLLLIVIGIVALAALIFGIVAVRRGLADDAPWAHDVFGLAWGLGAAVLGWLVYAFSRAFLESWAEKHPTSWVARRLNADRQKWGNAAP